MAEKLNDVVVVGELNIDLIMNEIASFPSIGNEVLAGSMTFTMGSSSAIFACNLGSLGSSVSFVGNLGLDQFGDHIISGLSAKGVDISFIHRSNKFQTGATVVLNVGEDRAMVTHQGAMKYLTLNDIPWNAVAASRHLHVSSIFLQEGILKDVVGLFQRAKESGLTTSLDPQSDPAGKWNLPLEKLLPWVDIFMPNSGELKALTGKTTPESAIKEIEPFAKKIVIKDGRDGASVWDSGKLIRHAGFVNSKVVDSIGAGDSFDAGFIHKFVRGGTNEECLEFGALMGAVNTTHAGGTTAFASTDLIRSIAKNYFDYTLS